MGDVPTDVERRPDRCVARPWVPPDRHRRRVLRSRSRVAATALNANRQTSTFAHEPSIRHDSFVVAGDHGLALVRERRIATKASLWRRFVAALADGAISFLPLLFALIVSWAGGPQLFALGFLGLIAIVAANDIALVARTGQSIGRRLLGVRVVDSSKMTPPNLGQVIFRTVLSGTGTGVAWRPIAAIPAFGILIGPWPLICYGFAVADRRWHRGLNDRWAHTVVIDVRAEPR